ncbi:MAG: acyl-CoA reductase-like NAD-dependent aldehyde dehydrogenase [Glaciecola sp.]|jgi:acyl-CoA reductase-like NAD-dependent aldehyde dehydrogenase
MVTSTKGSLFPSKNYIAGKWTDKGKGTLKVLHKYTGKMLAEIPLADHAQLERATKAAQAFAKPFAAWSAAKRQAHLQRLHDLLSARRVEFAKLIVQEAGKPIGYAQNEVERCLITLSTAAAECVRFGGEVVPVDFGVGEGKTAFTKRIPVGIVACITPFNFPLNLVLHKVGPALATGCPVLLKPAPQAPLVALAFTALMDDAGYPKGAISTFACANDVAETMVRDNRIGMLSFTGSDMVGWFLKGICGKKKVALELGGNAAVLVDEDADVAFAAKQCAIGSFLYAGQICISTQRIYVHTKVFEPFKKALIKETKKLETGDPSKEGVSVGPLIDAGHLQRIATWVTEAKAAGSKVLVGGRIKDEAHNIYAPTVLTDVAVDQKVTCAEAFGPIVVLEEVVDFDQAIQRTNDSDYGLQAGVFTTRIDHMKKAHEELEVGGVIINNIPGFRVDSMPYGGIKNSGLGREGIRYAMEEMTEPRLLVY